MNADLPPAVWEEVAARVHPNHRLFVGPWVDAWARNLLPRGDWLGPLRFAVARDGSQELLAAVPFAIQKLWIFRIHSLAGYWFPLRVIPVAGDRESEAAAALAPVLSTQRGIGFRFGPVERGDPFLTVLVQRLASDGWSVISRRVGEEFLVHLPGSVEEFRGGMSRNMRSNIPYKERRMNREGRVRVAFLNGVARADWEEAVSAMGEVESKSWVGRSGGHLHFRDERNARFWCDFLSMPGPSHAARAWILYFNDQAAAFYFSLDSGDYRHFIAGLYSEPVASYSPGYILMQRMLEDAILVGLRCVNLGMGDAGYKSRWGATAERQLEDWVVLRPGLTARGLVAAWRLRELLQRARKSWRERSARRRQRIDAGSQEATV